MNLKLSLDDVELFGTELNRPEGVMVSRDGSVWCADGRGACTRIDPNGNSETLGDLGGIPNGICLSRDGSVVIANIGSGEVQRLFPDGRHELISDTVGGKRSACPNFPFIDKKGRLWVTNSTDLDRHIDAARFPIPDGSLYVIEGGESRVLAEGIRFANGVTLDEKEEYVYVAETQGHCILRYRIHDDGTVGRAEQYGPDLGDDALPDGVAFDSAGNLWVPLVSINTLAVITPDQEVVIALHDPEGKKLKRPTNICFGGDNLQTAYMGSLDGTSLLRFQVPCPGMPLIHQL
jgi:sugar lactone lactonase YvrE